MSIDINDLAKEINKTLNEYTTEVTNKIDKSAQTIGKKGVKLLKEKSPKYTGEYGKGWRLKKTNKGYVIHNATEYRLTHLLEKGHAKVGGGRVAPRKHIEPVEKQVVDEFVKEVEEALKG